MNVLKGAWETNLQLDLKKIGRNLKEGLFQLKNKIIWLTGQIGSGKTTIAKALKKDFKS